MQSQRKQQQQKGQKSQQEKSQKKGRRKNNARNGNARPVMLIQNTPAPIAKGVRGSIPDARFQNKPGCVIVRHSELLGDVSSVGNEFAVTGYSINPGLSNFTGWLSNVARNYESYRFRMLKFKYIAACSTTTPGQVYVTVDFDASDPAPLSEKQISYFQGTRYSAPWNHQEYHCTVQNLSKRKSYYVRSTSLSANQDVVLYDTGNLYVATSGTGSSSLGKLWIEYEVEFETPEFQQTPAGLSLSGRLNGNSNFTVVPSVTGNLPLTYSVNANVLTVTAIAPYSGLIGYIVAGTTITGSAFAAVNGGTVTERSETVDAAGQNLNGSATFTLNPGQGFTYIISAATVTAYNLRIGQYNYSLV